MNLFFLLIFSPFCAAAQIQQTIVRSLETPNQMYYSDLITTHDTGYAISSNEPGFSSSFTHLIRLDSNLNVLWTKTLGLGGFYQKNCLIETSDHNFLIAGTGQFTNTPSNCDFDPYLIKLNSSGNILWSKAFCLSDNEEIFKWVGVSALQETADGGFAISGNYNGVCDFFYLLKTDANGVLEWSRRYVADYCHTNSSFIQISDHGYVLVGQRDATKGLIIMKTDSLGTVQWSRIRNIDFPNSNVFGPKILELPDEKLAILGVSAEAGGNDLLFLIMDMQGNIFHCSRLGGINYDDLSSSFGMFLNNDGEIVFSGSVNNSAALDRYLIGAMDTSGNLLWDHIYHPDTGGILSNSIVRSFDNGIVSQCYFYSSDSSGYHYRSFLIKHTSEGESCKFMENYSLSNIQDTIVLEDFIVALDTVVTEYDPIYSASGTYSYIYDSICTDTVIVTAINGVLKDPKANILEIYPNPVTKGSFATIKFAYSLRDTHYSILNSLGQIIQEGELNSIYLETDPLNPGFYILQIRREHGEQCLQKFIVH